MKRPWLPVLMAAAWSGALAPASPPGDVYYQATYEDGRVADLSAVPAGCEGIRGVVRIVLPAGQARGAVVLSTHPPNFARIPSAADHLALQWNGQAWEAPAPRDDRRWDRRPAAPPEQVQEIKDLLEAQRRRLERTRREPAAPDVSAQLRHIELLEISVRQLENLLATLEGASTQPATGPAGNPLLEQPPTGTLGMDLPPQRPPGAAPQNPPERVGQPPAESPSPPPPVVGASCPVDQVASPAHRVQVWPLPPGQGRRTIVVAMAHPEAGYGGAFYYVAYADADQDGLPDTLIARSDLAAADRPGGWTSWSFTTDEPAVFVGNAWAADQPSAYMAPTREGAWLGPEEVYVSGIFGGPPCRRWEYLPFITNLRVRIVDQNPDPPSGAHGVRMIRTP